MSDLVPEDVNTSSLTDADSETLQIPKFWLKFPNLVTLMMGMSK